MAMVMLAVDDVWFPLVSCMATLMPPAGIEAGVLKVTEHWLFVGVPIVQLVGLKLPTAGERVQLMLLPFEPPCCAVQVVEALVPTGLGAQVTVGEPASVNAV